MAERDLAERLVNKLIDLHNCKYKLLQDMEGATSARCKLNEAEKAEEILRLLEIRQDVIEKINVLDVEIYEITGKINGLFDCSENGGAADNVDPEMRQIAEIKEKQRGLIKSMLEKDSKQSVQLANLFEELKSYGDRMKTGRQTLNAYHGKPSPKNSIFVDEKK